MAFAGYVTEGFFDEMIGPDGRPRPEAALLMEAIEALSPAELRHRQRSAERAFVEMGITFNVYGDKQGAEKIFPFDLIPRILGSEEWSRLERGLKQRIQVLNLFLGDVYGEMRVVSDGIVPEEIIRSAAAFRVPCIGIRPPKGVWCHITGTDLVRDSDGTFYVLEDNLRCPSGVSYVLENRQVMKQTFPQVFAGLEILPVDTYPSKLLETLERVAPATRGKPKVVVLTPGPFNSAYFEHSFLAQQMGVELVEGRDLVVFDDAVHMRTTQGFERVDVIYRRIDDDFLDPETFRDDSLIGVPGLMRVYEAGRVTLVNAPGTGIADDKVLYAYVPRLIEYYLGEEALIPNVPTYMCWEDEARTFVLDNLESLVVKAANEAGGYGMLIGPHSTAEERAEFAERIRANPRNYIAQPTLALSRVPSLCPEGIEGRHVDLRPYILYGEDIWVLPGGLTRVALRKGSLVVNSSQGGGSKDTWVLASGIEQERS